MSILGTTADYTVTIQASSSADDPFEIVQGAHFMQLLLAQLRPRRPLDRDLGKYAIEQLARIDLLQAVDETAEGMQSARPAGQASRTLK